MLRKNELPAAGGTAGGEENNRSPDPGKEHPCDAGSGPQGHGVGAGPRAEDHASEAAAADGARPDFARPDFDEAERFLNALDPTTLRFTFQTFDDNTARRKARAAESVRPNGKIPDPFAKVFHGTLAQHWSSLVELHSQGAGIFVTVNETNLCGRTTKDITRVRVVFVDLDGAPLEPVLAHHPKPRWLQNLGVRR